MRKTTALFTALALALALSASNAFACDKTKTTASNASAKSGCSANSGAVTAQLVGDKSAGCTITTASADGCKENCKLETGKYAVAIMKVDGMTCGGCESGLTSKFEKTNGVLWVASVSHVNHSAKVIYEKSACTAEDLAKLVNDAGYQAEIVPAVMNTLVDDNAAKSSCADKHASLTDADKAACAAKMAKMTDAEKAACEAKCASKATTTTASTDEAKATMASAKTCEGSVCSQLTEAEHAAFCAKFCVSEKADTKSASKSS
ncbi:MAG TPA: heavy-metal-associated domain-containing protein [candidate division Zixibacteria bacterium]|nr:heavy-metal-associated domain-containing protein [candidate division Zixibacteria bacterium]